jgi:hypothetical protein
MPETTYLEEAAAELRTARDGNEKREREAGRMDSGREQEKQVILARVAARRMEIAAAFTALAAIDAGLPPAYPYRPGPETP